MEKYIIFALMGILCLVIGIFNCLGNISTIKRKNRRNVAPADVPAYGRLVGIGTIIMGASMLAAMILELILKTALAEILILPGFLVGAVIITVAQFRYNKGF